MYGESGEERTESLSVSAAGSTSTVVQAASERPLLSLLVDVVGVDADLLALSVSRVPTFRVWLQRVARLDDALSLLTRGSYDLLLVGLHLPDASGGRVVAELRRAAPHVPIVALLGPGDEELGVEALRLQADECIVKSDADEAAVARAIRHALERRRWAGGLMGLFTNSPAGMVVIDATGSVRFANTAAADLLGHPGGGVDQLPFALPMSAKAPVEFELPGRRVVEVRLAPVQWEASPAQLALLSDVTERRRAIDQLTERAHDLEIARQRLERLATHDLLTGVLNRRGIENVIETEIERCKRSGTHLSAILVDCDDFKNINDRHGYFGGDVTLREIARRIEHTVRPADRVGRIAGDEFLVLLPDTHVAEAVVVAERVRQAISATPVELAAGPISITASLGVSTVTAGKSIDELPWIAQNALRLSKANGKNRVSSDVRPPGLMADTRSNVETRAVQPPLLDVRAIRPVAQPILRLADDVVVGHELLVRMPHGGFSTPSELFRAAAERDVLADVDLQCLRACVREATRRRPGGHLHVNLFPSTLIHTPTEHLIQLFQDTGDPTRFCIELSESAFVGDPTSLRDALGRLRECGLRIALDDVGFGRSSLEALIVLDPEVVKIARTWVHGVASDSGKRRQLKRLINVMDSLGVEGIAEGVETTDDLAALKDMGVRFGQGFLFGKPVEL